MDEEEVGLLNHDYIKYGNIGLRKHSLLTAATDFIISFIVKMHIIR
jgi:hypothetical protein